MKNPFEKYKRLKAENKRLQDEIEMLHRDLRTLVLNPKSERAIEITMWVGLTDKTEKLIYSGSSESKIKGIYNISTP